MGVRKDLRRARRRADLAGRATVELIRENGTVREVRSAPLAHPAASGSAADIPFVNAQEAPDAVVLRRKEGDGWRPVTAAEFAREVTAVAKGLVAAGLEPGGRVVVMSRTRYEWTVLDFAVWAAGGQSVPVYATSSAEQIAWILSDSGARFAVVENDANAAAVAEAARRLPVPPRILRIDGGALHELAELGAGTPDEEIAERRSALGPDSIATLCYTSGTTGRPKGCVLTHGNLHAEAANTVELLHPVFEEVTGQTASTLLFLPLAHILGRTIQLACLLARIELGHCPGIRPDELRPELRSFRPTFVVGVPYLFEKIHDTGRATAEKIGRGASFERADRVAVRFGERCLGRFLGRSKGPGPGLYLAWALYDLLVYRRVRKELGGRLRYAISGGSRSTAGSISSSTRPGSSSTRATASPRPPRPPPSSRPWPRVPAPSVCPCPGRRYGSPTTARSWSREASSSARTGTTLPPPRRRSTGAGSPPETSAASTARAI